MISRKSVKSIRSGKNQKRCAPPAEMRRLFRSVPYPRGANPAHGHLGVNNQRTKTVGALFAPTCHSGFSVCRESGGGFYVQSRLHQNLGICKRSIIPTEDLSSESRISNTSFPCKRSFHLMKKHRGCSVLLKVRRKSFFGEACERGSIMDPDFWTTG